MISLITGRLHPESQIVHTARHRAKYRHHRVFSIDNIRIIAAQYTNYVQYYLDVLNLQKQGRNEHIPLNSAGILKLPPISLPIPIGVQKEAISPPSPPELPPILLSGSQRLIDLPYKKLCVYHVIVNWATLLLTKGISPAALRQATIPQSFSLISWALTVDPIVVLLPFWSKRSLTEVGIPKRGGRYFSGSQGSLRVQFFLPVIFR